MHTCTCGYTQHTHGYVQNYWKNLKSPIKKRKPVEVLTKTFNSFTYYKALKYTENSAQLSHDVCTTQQLIANDDQSNIPYIFLWWGEHQ